MYWNWMVVAGAVALGLMPARAFAQDSTAAAVPAGVARIEAARATAPIELDGVLDETAWSSAAPATRFTQRVPVEGAAAAGRTEVRVLFDDDALYVGARMEDAQAVTSRLGRRDMDPTGSDWLRIALDTHRDRRTAYLFEVNPAGVRRDAHLAEDSENASWDPVWEAVARPTGDGWTVELRIPFAALRVRDVREQVWGIQIERVVDRLQETSVLAFTTRAQAGGIAAYGELVGLSGVSASRGVEVIPYVVSTAELVDPGSNPYRDDSELSLGAGVDATLRTQSGLVVSGTINPDFGQVEVDPAVINLTAFETFFEEKRPFFVEGASNFDFGGGPPGPWSTPSLFYSRRIGRAPQLRPATPAADVPESTSILGAVKLTGRTAGGWRIGVLDAVTQAEYARYRAADGADERALAEPRANAFVARVQREFDEGRGSAGGIVTVLNRDLESDEARAALRSSASVLGVDFGRASSDRSWIVSGLLAGSRIGGSESAMVRSQTAPARYFDRPDADHLEVDSAATSLAGYYGQLRVQKSAGEHVRADVAASLISPEFEVNELGFQSRADRFGVNGSLSYSEREPGAVLRSWSLGGLVNYGANLGGDWIDKWSSASLALEHTSYWMLILAAGFQPERVNDRLNRGGPLAASPASWNAGASVLSDPRQPISGSARARIERDDAGYNEIQFGAAIDVRPSERLSFSVGPSFVDLEEPAQFVTSADDPTAAATYGTRYFFAPLRYTELSIETRLNVSFTTDLTLELFMQPLLSRGAFSAPIEFDRPGEYSFRSLPDAERVEGENGAEYHVDPDGDGPAAQVTLPDPDFRAHALRGNAVLRWEWRPGSTLFFVWQQSRAFDDIDATGLSRRDASSLLSADSDNVFAVKLTYWLDAGL